MPNKDLNIIKVTTDDIRKMNNDEGIVFTNCGGDLKIWVEGINSVLTKSNILLNGTEFNTVYQFENEGATCLLFPFEDGIELNIGKFAVWRLQTYSQVNGIWLSDYVSNRLGGFIQEQKAEKPVCELIGHDGNIFSIMGRASRALQNAGMKDKAEEMIQRITDKDANVNYYQAIGIVSEYVNIYGEEQTEAEGLIQSM